MKPPLERAREYLDGFSEDQTGHVPSLINELYRALEAVTEHLEGLQKQSDMID